MVQPVRADSRLRLSAETATELAARFGTPLYVVSEDHFRERVRKYRRAFEAVAPGGELSFASKANSTLAVLAIAYSEGCGIDVASEGEMRAALLAGVPASRCHLHGNNKGEAEIAFALASGVGLIVVDNFVELERLAKAKARCELLLRLAPGVDPVTHHKISTGQADTKFGFNIADGAAMKAATRSVELGLNLAGFHGHVGSQLLDAEAQTAGGEALAEFAVRVHEELGLETRRLNFGGGLGVRYTDEDQPEQIEDYCRRIVESIRRVLAGTGLEPKLMQEPGRSLIAESGVTLYRVGPIKEVPISGGKRVYVSVDGGLSDNPRPAMYESRYTVETVGPEDTRKRKVTVSGKHCETDTLFPDVELPEDLATGDLLQVLCTGAYNASMASNYNRFPRPASVLVRSNGRFDVVQERESWESMFGREVVPKDLA